MTAVSRSKRSLPKTFAIWSGVVASSAERKSALDWCGVPERGTRSCPAAIGALQWSGMIAAVTLRLLYLIFQQVLGLILLTCRAASSKDIELLVLRPR